MSIFDEYISEVSASINKINSNLDLLKRNEGDRSSLLSSVESENAALIDLIKQTELEIRGNDAATRKQMTERLKPYKDAQVTIRNDIDGVKFSNNKAGLMSLKEQKNKADDRQAAMERQNETLLRTIRTCEETEDLAVNQIMPGLASNREAIQSAQAKTTEISGLIDTAKKTTDSMTRRHKTWGFF